MQNVSKLNNHKTTMFHYSDCIVHACILASYKCRSRPADIRLFISQTKTKERKHPLTAMLLKHVSLIFNINFRCFNFKVKRCTLLSVPQSASLTPESNRSANRVVQWEVKREDYERIAWGDGSFP